MLFFRFRIFLFCCLLLSIALSIKAEQNWNKVEDSSSMRFQYGSGEGGILNLYQKYISPIKGGNTCPMYPSCSQYAKIAFGKMNPFLAYLTSSQRLLECGNETHWYDKASTPDGFRYVDTLQVSLVDDGEFTNHVSSPKDDSGSFDCRLDYSFPESLQIHGQNDLALREYYKLYFSNISTVCKSDVAYKILELLAENPSQDLLKIFNRYKLELIYDTNSYIQSLYLTEKWLYYKRKNKKALNLLDSSRTFVSQTDRERFLKLTAYNIAFADEDSVIHSFIQQNKSILPDTFLLEFTNLHKNLQSDLKSPYFASFLSGVIPGAGYMYVGRSQTGIAALIVNSLFIATTVEFLRHKQYAAGSTAIVIGSGWYLGTIRGSFLAAKKYNSLLKERRIDKFRNKFDN